MWWAYRSTPALARVPAGNTTHKLAAVTTGHQQADQGPVEMPVRRCGGNESWKVKVEMASSKSKSYGDSYSRIAQAIHILVPLHHLNWSFIHWCQFLLITMLHLVAATGDDRLKSPQPLLLTPEQTRPKLAICGILEKQLRFSVLTQPL